MRTFAVLRSISEPFNAGHTIEIKLTFSYLDGELYLRVPVKDQTKYEVGQTYAVSIQLVP